MHEPQTRIRRTVLISDKLGNLRPAPKLMLQKPSGVTPMLGWALIFFLLAILAAYLGFFGLAGLAATIAKILLVVFVVLLIVSAISGAVRGRPPV